MNAKKLTTALLLLAAAGSTFAQTGEYVDPAANFVSSKSKAEVMQELKQARSNGELSFREDTYPVIATKPSMQGGTEKSTTSAASDNWTGKGLYFGA